LTLLADAGYFSADNVDATVAAGMDPLLATGRLKHRQKPPTGPTGANPGGLTPKQLMGRKLRTKAGKAEYAPRKAIVEPVFGQMSPAVAWAQRARRVGGYTRLTLSERSPRHLPRPGCCPLHPPGYGPDAPYGDASCI
jgi:hypothetical protein